MWIAVLFGIIFIFLALRHFLVRNSRRTKNYPPSPPGWPIIGNLPDLVKNMPETITAWNKKLGSTIAVFVGSRPQVYLSDYDTVKAVYNDENTAGRDQQFIIAKFLQGKGLLSTEGEFWKEQRRFALSKLRDLGMGKSWMEDAMLDEINELIDIYRKSDGEPVNPRPHLTLAVSNVICAMVFGKRFEHSDRRFEHLSGLFATNITLLGKTLPIQVFPFLKYIPGVFKNRWDLLWKNFFEIREFVSGLVLKHNEERAKRKTERPEDMDYIEYFVEEQEKQKNNPHSTFDDAQLLSSVLNLFAAGTETSTSTILWAFVFMMENPDVLIKIQEEIDANIGQDRPIRMSDKAFLKYTDAALLEVQRLASVIPLGIPHRNFEPMQIEGYDIPASTLLSTNAYSMHRDPKYWKHPEQFCPEHFMGPDGDVMIPKGFIPFGIGKRVCLGESLAKMNVFLFFTNIVQKLNIHAAPGSEISSKNSIAGLARIPRPFELVFQPRASL